MFYFGKDLFAAADKRMNNHTAKNLWNGFCFNAGEIELGDGEELTFIIGETKPPVLENGAEFAICVDESGVAIKGSDYGGLMRGFCTLLMKIQPVCLEIGEERFALPYMNIQSKYNIGSRMIHLCIFPETDLYFIRKCVRLAGVLGFTHTVLEFWGMLKFDCMKELSWDCAFTKAQIAEVIAEIREFGMEPIPMFNQLGHATASRVCYGKHVVLDQNPRLQEYFTPDGWCWNIASDKVFDFLKKVRYELYELFGDGEYMHIGCDEAYFLSHSKDARVHLADYLARLTAEVASEGRRPMLWMDMLLPNTVKQDCYGVCPQDEADMLLSALHRSSVMVDWQYSVKTAPVPSLMYFKDKGLDLIGAPWLSRANISAHIDTICDNSLSGIMLTTWHTLKSDMTGILHCAQSFGTTTFDWSTVTRGQREETATLLRRLSFEGNKYSDSGWSKKQVEV